MDPMTNVIKDQRLIACSLSAAHRRLLTAYCLLPSAFSLLPSPFSLLPSPFGLPPSAYRLHVMRRDYE
jgi:hypothetical protein